MPTLDLSGRPQTVSPRLGRPRLTTSTTTRSRAARRSACGQQAPAEARYVGATCARARHTPGANRAFFALSNAYKLTHPPGGAIGQGAFATAAVKEGQPIFADEPLAAMQHFDNAAEVVACLHCMRFVGTLQTQLSRASGIAESDLPELPGLDDPELADIGPMRPCPGASAGCGAVFCSERCMRVAVSSYHYAFCEGARTAEVCAVEPLSAAEASRSHGAMHAMMHAHGSHSGGGGASAAVAAGGAGGELTYGGVATAEKRKDALAPPSSTSDGVTAAAVLRNAALETNEAIFLTGRVYAIIMSRWAMSRDVDAAVAPFSRFHAKPWWEVVMARADEDDEEEEDEEAAEAGAAEGKTGESDSDSDSDYEEDGGDAAAQEAVLRETVDDALALLKLIFWNEKIHADTGLERVFTTEFLANVMGIFELNNIAIEISGPVLDYLMIVQSMPDDLRKTLAPTLHAIQRQRMLREGHTDHEEEEAAPDGESKDGAADAVGGAGAASGAEVEWPEDWHTLALPCQGTSLFPILASINHSCAPNCCVKYLAGTRLGFLVATTDIDEGEELFVSYVDDEDDLATRTRDLSHYQFVCACARCVAERGDGAGSA